MSVMYFNPSFFKRLCTVRVIVCVFLSVLAITVIVCSIVTKISYRNKIRKYTEYFEDDGNDTYDDYYETRYPLKTTLVNNILLMKKKIFNLNNNQYIFNMKKSEPVKEFFFIIVIKVHENTMLLKSLLMSLKKVVGINTSLLIFCHDYYDNNINNIIKKVYFTKYMQIFYPYSNQLYPKMFPGNDKMFCSGDFNCTVVKPCGEFMQCLRSYTLVQQKHFWWWSMNFVFDYLKVTKHHSGPIAFLEEGQYVLDDFLFMLKVLGTSMASNYPQCQIINLGRHAQDLSQYHITSSKVFIEPWDPGHLNVGLAFNRTVWNSIKSNSYYFCHFDDYRWEVSLNYLARQRAQGHFVMLALNAPRVLQVELCDGFDPDCTLGRNMKSLQIFAKSVSKRLFPRNLIVNVDDRKPADVEAAGEWKDVRDRALCMFFSL